MEKIIQECAQRTLKMVDWQAGDKSGSYIEEDALGGPNKKRDDNTLLVSLSEESRTMIRRLEPTPDQLAEWGEEGENVALGRYFEMAPRGRIELYWERIGSFFWHIAADMLSRHKITAYQLSRLVEATVAKTAFHEMFHHQADVLTTLFGTRRQFPDEEALAVAASYYEVEQSGGCVSWNWNGVPKKLREDFLILAYRYHAPGYRDWVNYKNRTDYAAGVFEYLVHPTALRLLKLASRIPATSPGPFHGFGGSLLWHQITHAHVHDLSDFVDIVLLPTEKTRANIKSSHYSYRTERRKNAIVGKWAKRREAI